MSHHSIAELTIFVDGLIETAPPATQTHMTDSSLWSLTNQGEAFAHYTTRDGLEVTVSQLPEFGSTDSASDILKKIAGQANPLGPDMQAFSTNSLSLSDITTDQKSGVSYLQYETIDQQALGIVAVWQVDQIGWTMALATQTNKREDLDHDEALSDMLQFILTRPSGGKPE